MNFTKATEIALQFEKDFHGIFKLIKIEDKRPWLPEKKRYVEWFTAIYENVVTSKEMEVVFPEDALTTCRTTDKEYSYRCGEIIINGGNEPWICDVAKSELAASCIERELEFILDRVEKLLDFNFDMSEIEEEPIEDIIECVETFLNEVKESKMKEGKNN